MESARSNCLIHEELADHDKMCTFVLGSFLLFYTYADSMYSLVRRNVPIHSFFCCTYNIPRWASLYGMVCSDVGGISTCCSIPSNPTGLHPDLAKYTLRLIPVLKCGFPLNPRSSSLSSTAAVKFMYPSCVVGLSYCITSAVGIPKSTATLLT